IALGASALQGMEQPIRMVDELGRRASLGAQRLAGGMRRIRLEGEEAAALHGGEGATARDAEAAVTRDALDDLRPARSRSRTGGAGRSPRSGRPPRAARRWRSTLRTRAGCAHRRGSGP